MASAMASGVCPLATCRTIRSRPRGVSRAFLCTFIRSSESLKSQQPQRPRSGPDGQPTESSQLARLAHQRLRSLPLLVQARFAAAPDVLGHAVRTEGATAGDGRNRIGIDAGENVVLAV